MSEDSKPPVAPKSPVVRAIVDYGGLAVFTICFFAAWLVAKQSLDAALLTATWGLVAGSVAALLIGLAVERRIAPLPSFTALIAIAFGAAALIFKANWLIQVKPTILYLALAVVMFVGAARGKNPLRALLSHAIPMTQNGWRKLTVRYGVFFLIMAAANIVVWLTLPKNIWVLFHFPGLQILSVVFAVTQVPMMMEDMKAHEAAAEMEP
jgi:intracellular septation protein